MGIVREGTPDEVNIALHRAQDKKLLFTWQPMGPAAFEQAKREHKFILLDGVAEWCHWCHVMDETTYLDPRIGQILRDKFVAIQVDIDSNPDVGERYADWGWPATIIFNPDAQEVGKFRGYIPPEDLLQVLEDVQSLALEEENPTLVHVVTPVDALAWIGVRVTRDLDGYYDPEQGSWGKMQKAPLGYAADFELYRADHGDKAALSRAVFTFDKMRALIDPVWGGVYQYSAATDWNHAHFEKLMTYQAQNLEAYAHAYRTTKEPRFLEDAKNLFRYMNTFLSGPDGAFFVTQDADVGAHDRKERFVDGHVYYEKDDAGRRALGIPRVDDHVYGFENGIAISATVALYETTKDAAALERARKAADRVLSTHLSPKGDVAHDAKSETKAYFLADAAALGRGLAKLARVTSDAKYRAAALSIAARMKDNFADLEGGAYFASIVDPAAAGVFARRTKPFAFNVLAARFYAELAQLTGDASWREQGKAVLAGISAPSALAEQGRMVGPYLLALEELGVYPWLKK